MAGFTLSTSEIDRLRTVVDLSAGPADDAAAASWAVLDSIGDLVGCDAVAISAMDPRTQTHSHIQWAAPGERTLEVGDSMTQGGPDEPFWTAYAGSPCEYPDLMGGRAVKAISETHTAQAWRREPMCEVLDGVVDEAVVSVPDGGGRTVRILLPRWSGQPFDDRDLFLLRLLQPHLEGFMLAARTPHKPTLPPLTDRQWEILDRVRVGRSNKLIARELGLSAATVRKHLENVFARLGVQSRGEAVYVAFGASAGERAHAS